MPFVGQPGLGGYGAMWDRRMLDSQMANERTNRQATLESMAASAQNREFAAQKQPLALEQLRLNNSTTEAQLPGIKADSSLKAMEVATQEAIGVDHKVEDAKITQRERNQKLIKEQAETIGQIAAQAAYSMDPSYFDPIRDEYTLRRNTVVKALKNMEGVLCPEPDGAFYLMAKLPLNNAEEFARFLLTDFDMDNETVMVAPGEGFYSTAGLGKDEIRIAYVLEVPKLIKAMTILEQGLTAFRDS